MKRRKTKRKERWKKFGVTRPQTWSEQTVHQYTNACRCANTNYWRDSSNNRRDLHRKQKKIFFFTNLVFGHFYCIFVFRFVRMRDWWKMLDGLGRHQSNGERSEEETSRHLIILLFCWRRILLFVVAVVTWNERVSHRTEASRQKRSAWPTADNHHKCVNERERGR